MSESLENVMDMQSLTNMGANAVWLTNEEISIRLPSRAEDFLSLRTAV